jgi:hypothetical protein
VGQMIAGRGRVTLPRRRVRRDATQEMGAGSIAEVRWLGGVAGLH